MQKRIAIELDKYVIACTILIIMVLVIFGSCLGI